MAENNDVLSDAGIEQKYQKAAQLYKAVNCLAQNKEKAKLCGELADVYKSLGDYRNSMDMYNQCIKDRKIYSEKSEAEERIEKKKKSESDIILPKSTGNIVIRIIIIVAVLALIGGAVFLTTTPGKYARASFLETINYNEKAYKMFGNLKNYRDSESRSLENCYKYAKKCMNEKKEDSAIAYFRKIIDYKDSGELLTEVEINKLKKAKVGDDVIYGECHWLVLNRKANEVFLAKYKPIQQEGVAYNDLSEAVTWENCTLRTYLNNRFLDEFLTKSMIEKIKTTDITVPDNKKYGTEGGNSTRDKVFLLNCDEVKRYEEILNIYDRSWWIINPGNEQNTAQFVSNGQIMDYGYDVSTTNISIRPAIVVYLGQ